MVRTTWMIVGAVAAIAAVAAPSAQAQIKAGVGIADAGWHVGASAGQYASTRPEAPQEVDPHFHQFKNAPSYGVQARPQMRAIVVEGAPSADPRRGRNRFALVKTDMYIPQDLLYRRAAQLIAEKGVTGIDRTNLTMSATHDHSSPYYTSTAWGAWTFQDVFDLRAYEYYANQIAEAVAKAAANLRPVRVGGGTAQLDSVHRNSQGPAIADDGSPAGYPYSYNDDTMSVVRFDDISQPGKPKPYAQIVNYSNHGEGLDRNDLISADWVGPMERMIDRDTGATTIFTQNAVGSSEPESSRWRAPSERREYYHRQYAQGERLARTTADAALEAWRKVGAGTAQAKFADAGVVDFQDAWFPGPLTHPYPAVASCRTDAIAQQPPDPRVPIANECTGASELWNALPFQVPAMPANGPQLLLSTLKTAGVPVPDNLGVPSFTGLEEDVSVHLQAFRIADILFTVCSCEQWADQSFNIKSRTDRVAGNEVKGNNLGYDWSERCTPKPGAPNEHVCPNPKNESQQITVSDTAFQRMKAQVNNDAFGWNSPEYARYAESEPADPKLIKGNFTQDDNATSAALGYALTVPIGMGNDYNGYIVSYREFQQGDHYRKSLAGWGPHSSDYMATRLVKLGRLMNGGPDLIETIRDGSGADVGRDGVVDPDADNVALTAKSQADVVQNDVRARTLGEASRAASAAYEATLPDDAEPEITRQPGDVQRFDLASVTWRGGSNYTDNPIVRVERRGADGSWDVAGDGSGEVVTTLRMPKVEEVPAYRSGDAEWLWTAHYEVLSSDLAGSTTKPGTYRFVIDGTRKGDDDGYRLVSREFAVGEWKGITVDGLRADDGRVSFTVGPRRTGVQHFDMGGGNPRTLPIELGPIDYPDSYANESRPYRARFIREQRNYAGDPSAPGGFQLYCLTCTFRAWADTGDAVKATITIARGTKRKLDRVEARESGGRWVAERSLRSGEAAYVCPGDVVDRFGNTNADLSAAAGATDVAIRCAEEPVVGDTPETKEDSKNQGGGEDTKKEEPPRDFGNDEGPGNVGKGETGQAASLGLPATTTAAARAESGRADVRPRTCLRRSGLRLRLRAPRRGLRIRNARVYVDGRPVKSLRGRAARRTFTIRVRPGRRVTIRIRMRTSDGKRYTVSRRFGACRAVSRRR